MTAYYTHVRLRCLSALTVGSLLVIGLICPPPASAQQSLKETTSLGIVPADAGFYATHLRNREMYDVVVRSKAYAKLREMPVVKMMLAQLDAQLTGQLKPLLEAPENKQLLELLGDMVSNEIFVYGDADYGKLFELLMKLNAELRSSMAGWENLEDLESGPADAILKTIAQHVKELKMPDTVIGFKLTKTGPAEAQLKRLEAMLPMLLAGVPQLAGKLHREKIGEVDYLTITLDGSMIPWDQIPMEEMSDEQKKQLDKIRADAKQITLAIALGVRGDYLLLSLGDSNKHLAYLGQGKVLLDRPELEPVRKLAEKPLASVAYASDAMLKQLNLNQMSIDNMVGQIDSMLQMFSMFGQVDKEWIQRIRLDTKELGQDLKKLLPQPGALMAFSYLTPRGWEGYLYDWSKNDLLDGSKKLPVLDHLGGDPIFFVANRARYAPENYELAVKWIKKIYAHADRFAEQKLEGEDRELYGKIRAAVAPLAARLDKANRQMLIPALKDGQIGFVLDAQLTSKQWHQMMPEAAGPLPMLELGLVYGVSDLALLKKACAEYTAVANDWLAKMHELVPDEVPQLTLPQPTARQFPAGTVYYYAFPAEWGLDKKLAPNAGLSEQFAVLSLAPLTTKRLLEKTPPPAEGPLANTDRPLASAVRFNWAKLLDTVSPWVDYAASQFLGLSATSAPAKGAQFVAARNNVQQANPILDQIHTGIKILQCFRGYSSVTWLEDDVQVTHFESHWKDLK